MAGWKSEPGNCGPLGQYWYSLGAQTKETEVQGRKSTSQGTVDSDTAQFHRG